MVQTESKQTRLIEKSEEKKENGEKEGKILGYIHTGEGCYFWRYEGENILLMIGN